MIYRLPVKRPWVTRGWPGIVVTCSIESVTEKKLMHVNWADLGGKHHQLRTDAVVAVCRDPLIVS